MQSKPSLQIVISIWSNPVKNGKIVINKQSFVCFDQSEESMLCECLEKISFERKFEYFEYVMDEKLTNPSWYFFVKLSTKKNDLERRHMRIIDSQIN